MEGKIVNDKSEIVIKNLHPIKRPISAVADNQEVRYAKIIKVKINKKLNLIYYMTIIEVSKKKLKLSK